MVEAEFERLESQGIIVPVQCSSILVAVIKHDASIRLCGDYRITINKAAKMISINYQRSKIYLLPCQRINVLPSLICSKHTFSWHCMKNLGVGDHEYPQGFISVH